jgi:hypothetical protein
MMPLVPQKTTAANPGLPFQELSDLLLSFREFVGADAGWIGLQEAGGGWTIPVRVGAFSDSWLPWQQSHGGVWGFQIHDEPAIFNDLKFSPKRGDPPLRNLLSCPLIHNKNILGYVALANNAHGFTSEDAVVLQALAHHAARRCAAAAAAASHGPPIELPTLGRCVLDRSAEAVLLLDESGVLIYANTAWLHWTDFRAEELLGRTAPFPFWVSQQDLVQILNTASAAPTDALPFRRRDQSVFFCTVETTTAQWDNHLLTIAFLRQTVGQSGGQAVADKLPPLRLPSLNWLALLLDLDNGLEGWGPRWEERTGLSINDVANSRCELVLDWLFPQQHERDRVADCLHHPCSTGYQLVLEVAAANNSRPMLCTFLPVPTRTATAAPRRWLLLVGEEERIAESNIFDQASPRKHTATDKT